MTKEIKFIDLFAGIGGIRIGLEENNFKCVFSSEIDSSCVKTYFENFEEMPVGDITKIDLKEIPNHDILAGGFPCQSFSSAGLKKGFDDTRGTLFFDILRIAKEKKPKVIFLENVKNLKYHDSGKTLRVIISSLEQLDYFVSWDILNAKDFGLPQNRERIIIIASQKKKFDFSKIKSIKKIKKIKDILEKDNKNMNYLNPSEYILLDNSKIKTQNSGLIFAGYRNKPIRTNGAKPNTNHLSRVHKQCNRIYSTEGTHPTLSSSELSGRYFILNNQKVRKITLTECYRLMGFPDEFKKLGSSSDQYRQIGNSVAIPMIKAIGEQIKIQLF